MPLYVLQTRDLVFNYTKNNRTAGGRKLQGLCSKMSRRKTKGGRLLYKKRNLEFCR